MSSFFTWSMRRAAAILFVIALAVLFATLISQYAMLSGIDKSGGTSSFGPGGLQGSLSMSLLSVVAAFQNAVLPLVAAAALWRWDRIREGAVQ